MNRFDAIGLSELDEHVYLTILSQPGVPRTLLAGLLRMPEEDIAPALRTLATLGLIRPLPGGADRFAANRPDAALSALAHRKLAELEELRLHSDLLSEMYRRGDAVRANVPLAELAGTYAPGAPPKTSGLNEVFVRLLNETEFEMAGFDGEKDSAVTSAEEIESEAPTLSRGVVIRALYRLDQILTPGRLALLRQLGALGEQGRVSVRLPHQLFVFDRRIALLPPTASNTVSNFSAVLVYSPTLITVILWLFEYHWRLATPVPPGEAGTSRELAMLLAAGLKDEAIAADLGLSVKTVRRRITALLTELGVGTRFEAGIEVARRGWL